MDQPRAEEGGEEGGVVGLQELAKTDRVLVQQVIITRICLHFPNWHTIQLAEYSESSCACCGYEGENEFEVTDRFGHQIFLAEEDSSCCFRQCCESVRGFDMNLTDRQGKPAITIRCGRCMQLVDVSLSPLTVQAAAAL